MLKTKAAEMAATAVLEIVERVEINYEMVEKVEKVNAVVAAPYATEDQINNVVEMVVVEIVVDLVEMDQMVVVSTIAYSVLATIINNANIVVRIANSTWIVKVDWSVTEEIVVEDSVSLGDITISVKIDFTVDDAFQHLAISVDNLTFVKMGHVVWIKPLVTNVMGVSVLVVVVVKVAVVSTI